MTKSSRLAFFAIIGGSLTISGAALAAAPPLYNHSIRAVALGDNGCLAATNQHPDVVPNYCTSYEGQRWNVTRLAGDKYAIRHPRSGLCLTVTAQEQGALVVLYPCHNTKEQRWRAVLSGPEYYRICNQATPGTDYCLQAPAGPGYKVTVRRWSPDNHQLWAFEP